MTALPVDDEALDLWLLLDAIETAFDVAGQDADKLRMLVGQAARRRFDIINAARIDQALTERCLTDPPLDFYNGFLAARRRA